MNTTVNPRSIEQRNPWGMLRVPVANAMDPAPKREGWEPYFVSVLLNDPVQKVVTYRPVPTVLRSPA